MIRIHSFTFNPFSENTYVLYDETGECAIIDPGCFESAEKVALQQFITENKLKPTCFLNTHCHIDHVLGNKFVADTWHLPLQIHEADLPTLHSLSSYAHLFGVGTLEESPEPELFLRKGDRIRFGNSELEVLFVPGHTPGHLAFVNKEQKFVISGDVLFSGSIGRTDLPGGSLEQLLKSIMTKIIPLGDDFTVYSGHGPSTQVGVEKVRNPFLQPAFLQSNT